MQFCFNLVNFVKILAMKLQNYLLVFYVLFNFSCSDKKPKSSTTLTASSQIIDTASTEHLASTCTKCSCPSFRPDSGDPETCINIRQPKGEQCGHKESEHKK